MKISKNLILGLFVFIIVLQVSTSGYFFFEFYNLRSNLIETRSVMGQNFNNINQNMDIINSDISDLRGTIMTTQKSLFETKSDLKMQISTIKAKASSDFSDIIGDVVGSVVSIQTDVSQGTGFIITDDGYVLTNIHVLADAKFANVITGDQDRKSVTLIGYSNDLDLALLKIMGSYDGLSFGDSDEVKVGEKVIAIGNPYGLSFSVSEGIISAVGRITDDFGGEYFQTDTALNPGNSGGPLINTNGEVIGINNFKIEGDNIGFALESNYVINEINLIALEKVGIEII